MDASSQGVQATPAQSTGSLLQAPANTCGNVPLDNARPVSTETTPNPLSYWPPSTTSSTSSASTSASSSSSASPAPPPALPSVTFFKETPDDPRPEESRNPSLAASGAGAEPRRNSPGGPTAKEPREKPEEVNHHNPFGSPSPARALQHNLPPIVGITSSHNYRGLRELQKQAQQGNAGDAKPAKLQPAEKQEIGTKEESPVENGARTKGEQFVEVKSAEPSTPEQSREPDNKPAEGVNVNKEVVNGSTEPPKAADHVFSVPVPCQKPPANAPFSRAPTPFVSTSSTNRSAPAEQTTESSTQGSNPVPSHPLPVPRTTTTASPQASAPSISTPQCVGTVPCPSPVDSPLLRVPSHPNGSSSPSGFSRAAVKIPQFGEASRHPVDTYLNNPTPFARNSHSNTMKTNSPFPDSTRPHSVQSAEENRTPKDLNLQSQTNQNSRLGFAQVNHSGLQRPLDQPQDGKPCRSPFELPVTKSQPFPQPHLIQPHLHQNRTSGNAYANNVRLPVVESHPKLEHFANFSKELHRPPENCIYPQSFKQASPKELDAQRKPVDGKAFGGEELPKTDSAAAAAAANYLRNELLHRDFSKQVDVIGNVKSNGVIGSVGGYGWAKIEPDAGNKLAYMNAQGKGVHKVHGAGDEFANRRLTDYQESIKQEYQSRFNVNADQKKAEFRNFTNPTSLRYPPVPQSNYDLNRQIYDTMTGGGSRSVQQGIITRPIEKREQFTPVKEQIPHVPAKGHSHFRDYPQPQDKGSFNQAPVQNKQTGRLGPDHCANPYPHYQGLIDNHAVYQNKMGQLPGSYVQPSDARLPPSTLPEHHRPATNSGPLQVPPYQPTERNRITPVISTAMHSQVLAQDGVDFMSKKHLDEKASTGVPFPASQAVSQPAIPTSQLKTKVTPSATTPARPKRESPLDLSVKTVRQSADSTAKDDGDAYMQNYRGVAHGTPASYPDRGHFHVPNFKDPASSAGAPKIDFTPNFSGFHMENHRPATSSASLHHKAEKSVLPPVESFKKFPAKVAPVTQSQDAKGKAGQEFASKYFVPPLASGCGQKAHQSPVQTPLKQLPQVDHLKMEAQKRLSNDLLRNQPSLAKIPKIDSWKLAFDQQIEQRLNSARMSQQQNNLNAAPRPSNGLDACKSTDSGSQYSNCNVSSHSDGGNHYRSANMYPQPPVQTSATPYNPAYMQQPQCQPATPQTPQEKLEQRENIGHSPDPEQIIKQISKGVMPDHKLLQDKNVLSILRSSLEEKEAKLMQLREAARRREKYKDLVTSDPKKPFRPYEQISKEQFQDKQSLPPFGAVALERMCAPPTFPGHRFGLTKPIDAIKIDVEPIQKYFKGDAEKSGIPSIDLSPHDDAQGPPADLDGLAAFLAARIRTKGELKQVGPGTAMDPGKNAQNQMLKGQFRAITSTADSGLYRTLPSPNAAPGGSPPKLVRETRLLPPMRRRLLSHAEEETPTTSSGQSSEYSTLPLRDPNGIRSSSETSVFDFRESDSEGEMPVLERQTLEGMRRDRKTFGSKQNVSTTVPDEPMDVDKPEVIAELDKSHPDPFWDTAFDMFVEQLEKRPPKRSIRKKNPGCRGRFDVGGDDASKADDSMENESISDVNCQLSTELAEAAAILNEKVPVQIKSESEELGLDLDKVEEVKKEPATEVRGKLSSTRLKTYRDEMMKCEKVNEVKVESEKETVVKTDKPATTDKGQKGKDGASQGKKEPEKKKEDSGIKTRGKSREAAEKVPEMLDFDSDSDERGEGQSDSSADDDDSSLSLSGLESESTDSEMSRDSENSSYSSSDDSDAEKPSKGMRMQTRLQTRSSRQRQVRTTGMKLRSKPASTATALPKPVKKKKKKKRKEEYYPCGKKKKPSFGDGSAFRPGWEEECYKFKQQLRMPEKLISISRPSKGSSASLPDLEPYRNTSSRDSSDGPPNKKSCAGKTESEESEDEANRRQKAGDADQMSSLLRSRNGKKSVINMLVNKYAKGSLKKQRDARAERERKSPRILPKATNKPELLPTPSLGIGKENVLKDKRRSKEPVKKKPEDGDSVYLGYFRKKTVNSFKEAFKQKVGIIPQEFSPVVLKSRTRTQTRDLMKRATLIEVFGDERPASAPPLGRDEDASTDQEKAEKSSSKKKPKVVKKMCGGVVTRGRGILTRSGRPGLRSTAVLRSNKAVQISKRHLNSGRKRNIDLLRIRAMASKKLSYLVADGTSQLPITKKRLKLRSVRRKFRSGFDYIRKKKKLKKDGDSADGSVKEKKLTPRPTSESVEDIQNEIKNWVINKGLGETILHRAARLGYTDVVAYCLEKMECSPSPRDNAGYTPLHEACSRGHLEIAKLLLMYGASVSESAKGGIRPLHEAAENGFTELIRLLLSFGADPLLETYTGHTALSLVTDEEARRLIQHHLADVQGNVAPMWTFQGPSHLFDPTETGYDPLVEPPSPDPIKSEYELEVSEGVLPPLYRLVTDKDTERRWVLMRDLVTYVRAKSKDTLLKQLGSSSVREMKLSEFVEQARCCNLLNAEKPLTKAAKLMLVAYDDKVRRLLEIEKVVV